MLHKANNEFLNSTNRERDFSIRAFLQPGNFHIVRAALSCGNVASLPRNKIQRIGGLEYNVKHLQIYRISLASVWVHARTHVET
jgi:hypothetical protein